MSARFSQCLPFLVLVATGILLAGCLSTSVGDVSYTNGMISISVMSPEEAEAYIQITVFRLTGLHQDEAAVFGTPVSLVKGENRITIPGQIDAGEYKLYVYVIQNGTRRTAVIRDIRV